ncbi:hypothetical protein C8R43DRAFT_1140288 [Mycena crocata]|nr:hypothetical protein C8R43DRAFT_1140288 [Mycena crocata]
MSLPFDDAEEMRLEAGRRAARRYRDRKVSLPTVCPPSPHICPRHQDAVNAKARERMKRWSPPEVREEYLRKNRSYAATYREGHAFTLMTRMQSRRRKAKQAQRAETLAKMLEQERERAAIRASQCVPVLSAISE